MKYLVLVALVMGCAHHHGRPTHELGFTVPDISGEVYVRNFTTAPFDPAIAAGAIHKGYDRIATGSTLPSAVYAQSLQGLRIGVYTTLAIEYPSFYDKHVDECQLVAGYEYLAEGCVMHRLCNQPRVRVSAPGCKVVS